MIARELGLLKREGQYIVGFALETENERAHAREKLERKNFDLIVLNSLRDPGAGFGHDTNRVSILDRRGGEREYPLKSKHEVANDIIDALLAYSAA